MKSFHCFKTVATFLNEVPYICSQGYWTTVVQSIEKGS